MMARQVEEVFYGAVQVSSATFFLFDGFEESRLARRQRLAAGALLMEAARRMDELRFFRQKIPSDAWVPTPASTTGSKRPPPELSELYGQCDGHRSIAEIGRRTGQLEFEVTRGVFQLVTGGFVGMTAPRPEGAAATVDAFNRALVEIHQACDAVGKGRELRAGVDQFATSTGVYGPLFSGAGPLEDGSLRGEGVARNVGALAGEDDTDGWLAQQLFEYAGFALFHAGSLLPRDVEAGLNARVAEMLKPFHPTADGIVKAELEVG
jgi:hypothetical protein